MTLQVGVDATPLIGPRTGIGNYTFDLIDAMTRVDDDVRVRAWPITWRMAQAVVVPRDDRVEVVRRFAPARVLRGLWEHVPAPPLEAFVGCDVFHGTNFLAPRSWRTPVVLTVHDLWFRDNPAGVTRAQAELAQLLPGMLRRAAAVITVSDFVRDQVVEWLPRLRTPVTAIAVAPHHREAVASAPPGLARLGNRPFALMLGSVNPRKNLALALDSWKLLGTDGPVPLLVVAGGVEDSVDPAGLVGDRGLADDVAVIGRVSDGEVTWLLEHATLMVSTSLHEGFGMPLIEAMAHDVPVVALDGGAIAEVTGGAASLVAPGPDEAEAFAAAVQRVLADDAERVAMIGRGRSVASGYSWDRTATQTLSVYRSVAG